MKTYVINLKRRPDRLSRFMEKIGNHLPNHDITVIEAVDGEVYDPYSERDRISEWNFKYLSERKLKSVIACCKSHLLVYEDILSGDFSHALVFEDDAYPNVPEDTLEKEINKINLPKNFGIIYLNQFRKAENNPIEQELIPINHGETAESYIISKEFAKLAYDNMINDMGAADRLLELLIQGEKAKDFSFFKTKRQIFYQYDRKDTDIQRFIKKI